MTALTAARGQGFLEKLNGPWHARALWVYLAIVILHWIEHYLPDAFEELSSSVVGDDQLRLLKQLRKSKGELGHSEWLRLNTSRMDANQFKNALETLKQAKLITYEHTRRKYFILPAGREVK